MKELIDIVVHEISLVDKAANKRKFTFAKRQEETAAAHAPVAKTEQTPPAESAPAPEPKLSADEEKALVGLIESQQKLALSFIE